MDRAEEFMRQEQNKRVLKKGSRGGLFECLSQHVFQVPFEDFQTAFQSFMRGEEEMLPFKSILHILDNTGNVPIRANDETEDEFKTRHAQCYDNIIDTCSDIYPSSNFLHVYLFAIATLIGRPIYVLQEDESRELSWWYFPFLYTHDALRDVRNYTAHRYITLFFSDDDCYMIDSSRTGIVEPQSYGRIGMYLKQAKDILLQDDVKERSISTMAKKVRIPEVQLRLQRVLSTEMITQCVTLYHDVTSETIYSRNNPRTLPALPHRPDKSVFVGTLLTNRRLLECLYKVSVNHKDGFQIWQSMESKEGFLAYDFRRKLLLLEDSILKLEMNALEFVATCRSISEELSERRGKVNKSVIGGSVVGIIGGGLAIAGIALAPVTFGASLGLTIAGASLGAAGGITGGVARAVEGVKQNTSINEVKEMQRAIAEQENNMTTLLNDIENMIEANLERQLEHSIEGPGINRRGFLAIGSVFGAVGRGVGVALAAIRVGGVAFSIASSVLAPISIVFDVGFLAEAAHGLRTGCKTGAGKILEQNARAIEMKINFFKCMLRGSQLPSRRIVN